MKHSEMLPLMGSIVTVNAVLNRRKRYHKATWERCDVTPWAGWVVGFRTLYNGVIEWHQDEPVSFDPTGTITCILVAPWPTMKGRPVPLDAFAVGGTPMPPDHGGWRNISPATAERCKRDLSAEMKGWPRKNGKWCKP